jgi:hypothetical protein
MNFLERFIDMFITPAKMANGVIPVIKRLIKDRHEVGCYLDSFVKPALGAHTDGLKIVNSLHGIEAARPVGPLVEMVGPIISPHYDPITPNLKEFLDNHPRVIYIALIWKGS